MQEEVFLVQYLEKGKLLVTHTVLDILGRMVDITYNY